jgi:hypothetical protein
MSNSPDFPTKQDVIDALAELKAGRSRSRAHIYIRSILRRYGGDARNIHELDPKFYLAVFAAAGGDLPTAEKFYGAAVDLPDTLIIPPPEEFYGVVLDVPAKPAKIGPPLNRKSPTRPILRLRTPLRAELEARLATAKAKTRRSVPGGRVDIGAPAQFGDEDAVRDYPEHGEKMS